MRSTRSFHRLLWAGGGNRVIVKGHKVFGYKRKVLKLDGIDGRTTR